MLKCSFFLWLFSTFRVNNFCCDQVFVQARLSFIFAFRRHRFACWRFRFVVGRLIFALKTIVLTDNNWFLTFIFYFLFQVLLFYHETILSQWVYGFFCLFHQVGIGGFGSDCLPLIILNKGDCFQQGLLLSIGKHFMTFFKKFD